MNLKLSSAILFVLITGGFISGCSMQLISSRISSPKGGGSTAATSSVGTCSTPFTPSTGMAAQVVVGQASMTASAPDAGGTTNSIGLNGPEEAMVLSTGQLVVSEWVNHRYLFFDTVPTANGTPADYVWGQPDFLTNTANTGGLGPTSMQTGRRVAWNGTQFFMTDAYNHRVLVFNAIPTSPASVPAYVLGQPNMFSNTINSGGRSANSIYSYHGSLFADSTRLAG
ncbi:hypothetical protein K2X30_08350 [bacterium]|nr:hypothetical protein [bacterium]